MFDRFFDMLNTRCLEEGIQKRKPDLAPYRTPDDSRLKVSWYIIFVQQSHGISQYAVARDRIPRISK